MDEIEVGSRGSAFPRARVRPRLAVSAALAVIGLASVAPPAAPAPAAASADRAYAAAVSKAKRSHRTTKRKRARAGQATRPLVFGVYPGGAAGAVNLQGGVTKPEIGELRLAALKQLRADGRPFVLHLYDSFTRSADSAAVPAWLAAQIADYTSNGFQVELVLTYRPADPDGDVAGFVEFVRNRVRQLGPDRGVTALQVTNEANVGGAPNAADGYYPGARDALVQGVVAAKDEIRRNGFDQLAIGFNWAYQLGPAETRFWSSLGAVGGAAFAGAVDWVGIDAYPGTWGPALRGDDLATATRKATATALRVLRRKFMPLAGLQDAPIRFAESGYPTGPRRTEAMQATVLRAAVEAASDYARKYNVSDYRWFDLRDADSAVPSFESQYGLMYDDYSPKPAFAVYRNLIALLG